MINDAGKHDPLSKPAREDPVDASSTDRACLQTMQALAEQIDALDGVGLRPRRRRARPDGRGRRADPRHGGRRTRDRSRRRQAHPLRGGRLFRRARPADAVRRRSKACGAAAGRSSADGRRGAAVAGLARPRRRRLRRADRRQRAAAAGPSPYPFRNPPPPAHARGRVGGRSISACARSIPSSPAAAASAWASSPAPASASRCCCRCWRATPPPTSS